MTPEALPDYVWFGLKVMTIFGIGLYTLFSAVMVRQEQLMSSVLEDYYEPMLRVLTLIHLVASLVTLVLAIVLL